MAVTRVYYLQVIGASKRHHHGQWHGWTTNCESTVRTTTSKWNVADSVWNYRDWGETYLSITDTPVSCLLTVSELHRRQSAIHLRELHARSAGTDSMLYICNCDVFTLYVFDLSRVVIRRPGPTGLIIQPALVRAPSTRWSLSGDGLMDPNRRSRPTGLIKPCPSLIR